jgi:hypothetical protein
MSNPFEEIEARLTNIENLLIDLKHNPREASPPSEYEEFFTIPEAALFLKVSIPTIYGITSKKLIPFMRRSQRIYFLKTDLVNYLKEGRNKSVSEISEQRDEYLSKRKG